MISRILLLLGTIVLITACGPRIIYEETISFEPDGWDQDDPALFGMNYSDTSKIVDVGMTFVHDDTYPFSNIWLFLEVNGPQGTLQIDTLEFLLAETDGQWLGKRSGKHLEVAALYQYGVKFSEAGNWSFKITQGMRHPRLEGIQKISFWIQESAVNEQEP